MERSNGTTLLEMSRMLLLVEQEKKIDIVRRLAAACSVRQTTSLAHLMGAANSDNISPGSALARADNISRGSALARAALSRPRSNLFQPQELTSSLAETILSEALLSRATSSVALGARNEPNTAELEAGNRDCFVEELVAAKVGYRDASVIPDEMALEVAAATKKRGGGALEPFPQKLHRVLSELEEIPGGTEIASFLPHGRAFAIHKPKKFVEDVMPRYFRMSRFASFQRQLNLYNFSRVTEGKDKGSYYHQQFLKGRPVLCLQMRRVKLKGNGSNINICNRIDFYGMSPVQSSSEARKNARTK